MYVHLYFGLFIAIINGVGLYFQQHPMLFLCMALGILIAVLGVFSLKSAYAEEAKSNRSSSNEHEQHD